MSAGAAHGELAHRRASASEPHSSGSRSTVRPHLARPADGPGAPGGQWRPFPRERRGEKRLARDQCPLPNIKPIVSGSWVTVFPSAKMAWKRASPNSRAGVSPSATVAPAPALIPKSVPPSA
jgi:hypothetical protein